MSKLTKMRITSYEDPLYSKELEGGVFDVLVNPEGYSYSYKINYETKQKPGSKATVSKFVNVEPEQIEFEFLFDKTGAIEEFPRQGVSSTNSDRKDGVVPDLDLFKRVVYNYSGKVHRTPFLKMKWGTLMFKGVLMEMTWNYKLFRPDGTPLRATVRARFKGSIENSLRVREQNDQSPDITHVRIVKAGDTLPKLAYEIYGNPAYYIKLAQFNKLRNFRNLQPGLKILLPSLVKE